MPEQISYFAASAKFADGSDTPRDFLERCIGSIEAGDGELKAFVATNYAAARAAADLATARWKSGKPLSALDGMPIGIKDIMETADMATEQGSALFPGWQGNRDCAAVAALREAGAVIVGKTVTTEFAATHPGVTRNPWDKSRTPGGSSSGSAAAVGAGMLPAALGTQVIGSTIRPASFCGIFGYKPSVGGINRGGSFDGFSQSCTGTLASTLAETWVTAREMSARAGGDPGYVGILGPRLLPAATKPAKLALLDTDGWEKASPGARAELGRAVEALRAAGVAISDRRQDAKIEAVEKALAGAMPLAMKINAWEGRWPLNTYKRDMDPTKLSQSALDRLTQAEAMSQDEYRILIAERQRVRETFAALKADYAACITLTASGAAPVGLGWTGDPTYAVPSSLLGVPAVSLPVLKDEGLPLGLQLMGFVNEDAALFATAGGVLAVLG